MSLGSRHRNASILVGPQLSLDGSLRLTFRVQRTEAARSADLGPLERGVRRDNHVFLESVLPLGDEHCMDLDLAGGANRHAKPHVFLTEDPSDLRTMGRLIQDRFAVFRD